MVFSQSDWFSLGGIVISLLGFGVSLWQIYKVKTAAESARDSAQLAKEGIRRLDSIIEFTSVSHTINEIKDACRKNDFERLPPLFDQARKALIVARENSQVLEENDLQEIQKSLAFFKVMEIEILKQDEDMMKQQKSKFIKSLIGISENMMTIANKAKTEEQKNVVG